MADTVAGGVYRNASGEGYHDANGKPVDAATVAEAQKLAREHSERKLAAFSPIPSQSTEALAAAMRSLITPAKPAQLPREQDAVDSDTTNLTAETERRARRS